VNTILKLKYISNIVYSGRQPNSQILVA